MMPTRTDARILFDALALEGGLLPPEWLAKVAALEAPLQQPADYAVPKGLELRDEITRYWRIAEALYVDFAKQREHATDVGGRAADAFVVSLLRQVFGFEGLAAGGWREAHGRNFQIAYEWSNGRVPVVVGAAGESLDTLSARHGDGGRRRSAWGSLQEYLNANDNSLWGIASNGLRLRIGRDNTSLTRPAWIEADLERIFDEDRFADFSVLWLVLHATRFAGQPAECPLEQWRDAAREAGTRARDQLRDGVEAALLALGEGFLVEPSNTALRQALSAGELTPGDYFNELLRLVYRMIFLVTVEERGILHGDNVAAGTRALYAEGYSMRRMVDRSIRRSERDRHRDKWAALRPVFAALGRAGGEAKLGLPELGGLFAPGQCPHLDASDLGNRALLEAVFRLGWLRQRSGLSRVNWKDMGPEELGSIYESLLELVPRIGDDTRSFTFAGAGESAGNERKLTGSYYTPDSLVQQLLNTALEPVIDERLAASDDSEQALLSITVVDPACGSGHFLLAAARRLATRLASLRTGGTPGAHEYRLALRDVVTHCIHGVDRNPMALELARMSLWLETYTPDRALGFLDHHLVQGDALLGLLDLGALMDGIPDGAFKALTGDDKAVTKTLAKLNRAGLKQLQTRKDGHQLQATLRHRGLGDAYASLDELDDDRLESVEAKRQRYQSLRARAAESAAAIAADLFLGAFLIPKRLAPGEKALTEGAAAGRFPTTGTLLMALDSALPPDHSVAVAARRACREANVLHWPLAFPQVFARGGFDVVLGNPPWERIKVQEQEFFAPRDSAIAGARNKAERERLIRRLEAAPNGSPERRLFDEFIDAKHAAEAASAFCHAETRYPLTGVGDVNTYALFTETAYRVVARSGRAGVVVPTGIATDDSTKKLFDALTSSERLVSLLAFENEEFIFPGVHHAFRFCLLTMTGTDGQQSADFVFFARQPAHIHDSRRRFRLTAQDLCLLNPNTRTCPVFRSEADAELAKKIYAKVPVLIDQTKPPEEGNPWGVSFTTMFHMSNDSHRFRDEPFDGGVPLYEAKMIHQFDHRWATYADLEHQGAKEARDVTLEQKKDPNFTVQPRYWVDQNDVGRWVGGPLRWFLGWRRITGVEKVRTLIASVMPPVGSGDSVFLWVLGDHVSPYAAAAFLGAANSLVLDFVTRQKVGGTNLSFYYMQQLPFLSPNSYSGADIRFIVPRILELTYTARDLQRWAEALGHTGVPFRWDPERRASVRAELDAHYARLYGLTRDELRYVLDPADVMGPGYPSETFRVLKNNEEREFGEYRTQRLVLDAWDKLQAGRLHASQRAAIFELLQAPPPVKPALSPEDAAAMSVLAFVLASGGSLSPALLVRAYGLRNNPAYVIQHAPAILRSAATQWAERAASDRGPSLKTVLQRWVNAGRLEWQIDGDSERIGVTASTPQEHDLSPWFRYEASLLLAVADDMPESQASIVDAEVPAEDRIPLQAKRA